MMEITRLGDLRFGVLLWRNPDQNPRINLKLNIRVGRTGKRSTFHGVTAFFLVNYMKGNV